MFFRLPWFLVQSLSQNRLVVGFLERGSMLPKYKLPMGAGYRFLLNDDRGACWLDFPLSDSKSPTCAPSCDLAQLDWLNNQTSNFLPIAGMERKAPPGGGAFHPDSGHENDGVHPEAPPQQQRAETPRTRLLDHREPVLHHSRAQGKMLAPFKSFFRLQLV